MVEAGTEECNVNKDCPAGRFCDVHTCRACLHAGASCHFIGEKIRCLILHFFYNYYYHYYILSIVYLASRTVYHVKLQYLK